MSWYEAAAYAEFAGKSLPTFHHWYRAADLTRFSDILRFSNFGNQGPRPVGQQPSLTSYGNYDMAGNVREWVWNSDGERRYTLGGAWSDPTYLYTGPRRARPHGPRRDPRHPLRPLRDGPAAGRVRAALQRGARRHPRTAGRRRDVRDLPAADRVRPPRSRRAGRVRRRAPRALARGEGQLRGRLRRRADPGAVFLPKNARPPFQTVIYCPPGMPSSCRRSTRWAAATSTSS